MSANKSTLKSDKLLKRFWREGRMIKSIAAELGMAQSSVKDRRRKLGLPPRRSPELPKGEVVKVYLDRSMLAAMRSRAHQCHASLPEYIRVLIRRDANLAPEGVKLRVATHKHNETVTIIDSE